MNIVLFLMTLDDLMGFNASHFVKLKEIAEIIKKADLPPSIIIEQMMEASAATNLAI